MKHNRKRRKYYNSNRPQVLVLNNAWKAINVYDYEDALIDWANGRADIIAHYDDDIRIRSGVSSITGKLSVDMACPSVIVMKDCSPSDFNMIKVSHLKPTKRNLWEREKRCCCYCGRSISYSESTIDHVYPKMYGGLNDWINTRVCCQPCNSLKDNKTISELGWKFPRRVGVPTLTEEIPKNLIYHVGGRIPHESWRPHIYWEVKTKEKVRDIDYPVNWE